MPAAKLNPVRERHIDPLIHELARQLETREEVEYAVELLRERGRDLRGYDVAAEKSLTREFLQRRYVIFGPEFTGPWPFETSRPLEVWMRRQGTDFVTGEHYDRRWSVEVMRARFVRLGRGRMTSYIELEVPVEQMIANLAERQEYGYQDGDTPTVYCQLRALINSGPMWIVDAAAKARLTRARTATNKLTYDRRDP